MEPVNEVDLVWATTEHGETEFRRKKLAAAAEQRGNDAESDTDLGCSLFELPSGGEGERDVAGYYECDADVPYWDGER